MTIAILSPPRTSTSGRAPVFRATMRFWISVESLKRPPTLWTMPSSFNSSSITVPFRKSLHDPVADLSDRGLQIVVDDYVIELVDSFQFALRRSQAASDLLLGFRAALPQALFIRFPRGRADENRHTIGVA